MMLLQPPMGDIAAGGKPDVIALAHMFEQSLQQQDTPRLAGDFGVKQAGQAQSFIDGAIEFATPIVQGQLVAGGTIQMLPRWWPKAYCEP